MNTEKLKVCIIGAGMIAQQGHIPGYRKLENRVELSAIYAPDLTKAEKVRVQFGIPRAYSDVNEMLEKEKPDLVSVCVPNMLHEAMTECALEHGANVICEKPLTLSYSAAVKLYRKAEEKGLMLCACQNQRFNPESLAMREIIQNGGLGNIYYGEFSWIRSRGVPSWGHFCDSRLNGAGAFADIGVHSLDLTLWLMGSPKVLSVAGFSTDRLLRSSEYAEKNADVEEFASGMVLLEGNKTINFKAAWCANFPDEKKIILLGDKCGATLPDCGVISFSRDGMKINTIEDAAKEKEFSDCNFPSHCRLIRNVVNYLEGYEDLVVKPEETLNVIYAIEKFYV